MARLQATSIACFWLKNVGLTNEYHVIDSIIHTCHA